MSRSPQVKSYPGFMKLLHWLIFVCVLAQLLIGFFHGDIANKAVRGNLMMIHKSIGLSLIVLSILFIFCGLFARKPAWPTNMPMWERICAHTVHACLYLLIFIMALSGWCMSTAAGYPSSWFGVFTVMAPWVPHSRPLAGVFSDIHTTCAWILVVIGGIHILAALKHQLLDRNHILKRMIPMR